ncbi:MAG: OmpA family protein [Nitrospirae bacterium]|nr:OmpA family protein [Nitrospirota bacterium]
MLIHHLTEYADQDRLAGSSRPARFCMPSAPEREPRRRHTKARIILASMLMFILMLLAPIAVHAVPVGTEITNTALATYGVGSVINITSPSNTVTTVTVAVRTPSVLEFLKYAPDNPSAEYVNTAVTDLSTSGLDPGPFTPLSPPVPFGSVTPVDLNTPVPLVPVNVYHIGEPFFIRLTDRDQNLDNLVRETVLVRITIDDTGDSELIRLTETGPGTGIFAGYIYSDGNASATLNNGSLSVTVNSSISGSYTDVVDGSDTSADAALVDPFGIIFDSGTGLPVDGAIVTLINNSTGLPASVFYEDGVTPYPSTVTSGDTAMSFLSGGYRFQSVAPGSYRIEVTPPAGYAFPSAVATIILQSLPGAPFNIVTGSRGEVFPLAPGPALEIDIPLDPSSGGLWLVKSASKSVVSIGDFLQYIIDFENNISSPINDAVIEDHLPIGFRYQPGSLTIDGISVADPEISSDERTLLIDAGDIPSASALKIKYVVEVAAGARPGKAVNHAYLESASGYTSNTASAEVQVKEDLLRRKSLIIGRVIADNCEDKKQDDNDGVQGIRIYLEDGTYALTDEEGKFHFEGVNPGAHVVQLDLESLPEKYWVVPCEENSRFAGRSFSQFVDLRGGTMWRADFHLAVKPAPIEPREKAAIELMSALADAQCETLNEPCKDKVEYEVLIRTGNIPLKNLRLSVMLPDNINYIKETSHLGGNPLHDPFEMENVLTYRMGDADANWEGRIKLSAEIPSGKNEGEFTTKALLTFDTQGTKNNRTPLVDNILTRVMKSENMAMPPIVLRPHFKSGSAVLSNEDKAQMDGLINKLRDFKIINMHVTGHTDSQQISKGLIKTYADNYKLSFARAQSVAEYLSRHMGLSSSQVIIDGKGPDEPVAGNETSEGMAQNRRVELNIKAEKSNTWHELKNIKDRSGEKTVDINEKTPYEKQDTTPADEKKIDKKAMPEFDWMWLNNAEPGLSFIWPPEDFHPPIPSIRIAVKHNPGKKLTLLLNGKEVEPLYLDGTTRRSDNKVAVSLWIGINLIDGENLFEALEYNPDGTESSRTLRKIHYSGPPVMAALVSEKSRLTADGIKPVVIAVRLTDRDGYPAREGVVGEYSIDLPYMPLRKTDELQKNPLMMSNDERLNFVVGEDGIALIELMPTSQTGEVSLRFNFISDENVVNAWLSPEERDWILVGLAEGTLGYNTVSGNMENLTESDVKDNLYRDGRVAFFAKGKIKCNWLLTIAYDSEKERDEKRGSLFSTIDPDTYYTLYGDATEQRYDAASSEKLYLKIERNRFYALFGDYNTGLTVTELSRYSRSFTGIKTEMQAEGYELSLFAADTNQGFIRDEIPGDGTSGLYHLSRNDIVYNSEKIIIETRDRFRSEIIIETRQLSRHIDYNIDYETGALLFKEPVFSKDQNMNPVYIVVNYEYSDPDRGNGYNYGGRGALKFIKGKIETGATYIHEGKEGSEGDLYGADVTLNITRNTVLKAEYASSRTENLDTDKTADAYLASLTHVSGKANGSLYYRELGEGFGLDQQNGGEIGTRKFGADARYMLSERLSIRGQAYRQEESASGTERDFAEIGSDYTGTTFGIRSALRQVEDRLSDGTTNRLVQAALGGTVSMFNSRLMLRADREQSIGGDDESIDFPTKTILGADYLLSPPVTLFAEHEFTEGENIDTENSRAGMRARPWNGGSLNTVLTRQNAKDGTRVFATMGLLQTWKYNGKWSFDGGFDHSRTIADDGGATLPSLLSGEDFSSVSLGASYLEEKWSWNWRGEARYSDTEERYGLLTGIYGEVSKGLGMSASLQMFTSETDYGSKTLSGDIRLGAAYRPRNTRWIVLDRLDLYFDEQDGPDTDYSSWKIVNNMNANYKPDRENQIAFHYGAKYVRDTFDGISYSGFTDLIGIEARHDVTRRWDIGAHGSLLHSWNSDMYDYGAGASIGCSIVKNAWVSLGYNFTGFIDRDFSNGKYTAKGPYIQFRLKFDQYSMKDIAKGLSKNGGADYE